MDAGGWGGCGCGCGCQVGAGSCGGPEAVTCGASKARLMGSSAARWPAAAPAPLTPPTSTQNHTTRYSSCEAARAPAPPAPRGRSAHSASRQLLKRSRCEGGGTTESSCGRTRRRHRQCEERPRGERAVTLAIVWIVNNVFQWFICITAFTQFIQNVSRFGE